MCQYQLYSCAESAKTVIYLFAGVSNLTIQFTTKAKKKAAKIRFNPVGSLLNKPINYMYTKLKTNLP